MSITGKIVCFTGKLSKDRDDMKAEAEAAGAETRSSMSKKVDYLIAGDQVAHNSEHKKYKQAVKYDIEVLSEDEYRKLLGKGSKKKAPKKKTPAKKKAAAKKTAPAKKKTAAKKSKLGDVLNGFTKSVILGFLADLKDETYRKSWTKGKLVDLLAGYGEEKVLNACTSEQLKEGLQTLGVSTAGNKSARRKRLSESL